ncbi:MAG TPA: hypothetical protein VGE93_03830, partial [Bryobacteraceae bacterium]
SVIQVRTSFQAGPLTGRVAAAVMQHTSLSPRAKKAARLFVLAPIEEADQRAKLRVDYYLEEMSDSQSMFCLSRDPKALGLNVENTYVSGTGDARRYCFEMPGTLR